MPKPTKGPRLGGSPAHERHMLANLAKSLFEHGQIKTTVVRAKRVQPFAERLIAKARRGDLHARRTVLKVITDRGIVAKLFEEIAPAIDPNRKGGYTRVVKLDQRRGDSAQMAVISLVTEKVAKREVVREAEATVAAAAKKTAQAEAADAAEAPTPAEEQSAE
ncbi:50S ribosomal protein L17 [Buchananella hordeovulneris]|uniref:50S ribosomal protein L17 n=1 Tax=Buchananella hordeovulneris TaxID=52770 RepID=UPI0026DB81FE|nr:50S ribosomal protein L17 [Buchananella hordeovulneris]MDO5080222.1 50S ribosomal protein L17 [Buchananella hordeovulneris]